MQLSLTNSGTKTWGFTEANTRAIPVCTGHRFLGWAFSPTATEPDFAYDSAAQAFTPATFTVVDGSSSDPDGVTDGYTKKDLYAVWEEDGSATLYSVSFEANAGEDAVAAMPEAMSFWSTDDPYDGFVVPLAAPTRDGFLFTAWNTQPDGSGTRYVGTDAISISASAPALTLYAMWEESPLAALTAIDPQLSSMLLINPVVETFTAPDEAEIIAEEPPAETPVPAEYQPEASESEAPAAPVEAEIVAEEPPAQEPAPVEFPPEASEPEEPAAPEEAEIIAEEPPAEAPAPAELPPEASEPEAPAAPMEAEIIAEEPPAEAPVPAELPQEAPEPEASA